MKRNYLLFLFGILSAGSYAQLTIQSGATFFIQGGATVTVQGDVTSLSDIQGTGLLQMKGSVLQTVNMNGLTIPNIEIDNGSNVALGSGVIIGSSFLFTTGKVQLNGFDLNLASAATLTGYDISKYFVTNNTGRLVRNSLGAVAFTFPVGFDATTYNPISLTQNGTIDNIGVRCLQNVLNAGSSGSPFIKEVVDASWAVTEALAGGSNLSMTSTWNGTDELPGFNRTKTGISNYDGVGWDLTNSLAGAASGAGPYTVSRTSISTLGIFAVGTRPVLTQLLVAPKVLLQGSFTTGTLMNDKLRTAGIIPLTDPYTGISNFSHLGSGGTETIPSGILGTTGTGADIVDWVFAQLHRSSDGVVIATRSVLLQRDGNVVDVDGTDTKVNYVNFAGEAAGSYYVTIRHRNHLGVRTAGLLSLSRTSATAYDFTTAQSQAYQNPAVLTNSAMGLGFNGTSYVMWAGNVNTDQFVRVTTQVIPAIPSDAAYLLGTILGGNPNLTVSTYSLGDVNMDGRARATTQVIPSIPSDVAYILSTVLGGNSNATRREHK